MENASQTVTFAIALAAGVGGHVLSRHLRVPSIVVLLASGVALGPDGLGWLAPDAMGHGLITFVSLGVAVILFEGAMGLDLRRLRAAADPIRRLVTWGALVTASGAALGVWWLMEWPVDRALLYGTLVIVTGPTVIGPLLRAVPVRRRLGTLLEAEGLLIDPVGAILAAVTLEIVVAGTPGSFASGAVGLVARLVFGAVAGVAIGWLLALLLRRRAIVGEGMESLVVLGGALLGYALCEEVLGESGILAVVVAGAAFGNIGRDRVPDVGEFQELLTLVLIGMLFVLLAADVRIADVTSLGWPGIAAVAFVAGVVRPLGVFLCTLGTEFTLREKLFVSWLGPRGVVAAAIASFTATAMDGAGIEGGRELRALVFLTIVLTVGVLGGGAPVVSRLLRVRDRGRDSIVILGVEELALTLGDVLRQTNDRIIFVDNNPEHCAAAERRGFAVVFGDALERRTEAQLRLERARAVIGLTPSALLNHHFVVEARDQFGVPELYVAADRESQVSERVAEHAEARVLFDRRKDVERWNVRLRHGMVEWRNLRFEPPPAEAGEPPAASSIGPDAFLILAVRRASDWAPMHRSWQPERGDTAIALVHVAEVEQAQQSLVAMGWQIDERVPEEKPAQAATG